MTEDRLGSGPDLDKNFDFRINTVGDIASTSGVSELEKDLSIQMVLSLSDYLGEPAKSNVKNKVAGTAENVALLDSRVQSVDKTKTDVEIDRQNDQIDVKIFAQTADGQNELVFNI